MLRTLFYAIIDAILPPRGSEARVAALTHEHLAQLRTEHGLPYHQPNVQALVWECKYRKNSRALALAGAYIHEELIALAAESLGKPLLVPVPMSAQRRRTRGYNQTELLCEIALAQAPDAFAYTPHLLTRTRETPPQQTLPRSARITNVKNSMKAADRERVKGHVCVVVDDVTTTGATLAEARRALLEAGAREVHTLALAYS